MIILEKLACTVTLSGSGHLTRGFASIASQTGAFEDGAKRTGRLPRKTWHGAFDIGCFRAPIPLGGLKPKTARM